MRDHLRLSIPLLLGLTVLLTIVYINEQQILRIGAYEPEAGMAYDLAHDLETEVATTSFSGTVPIEMSPSPYLVVYDSFGKPLYGSGLLHGELPTIPPGIFDVVRSRGSDMLTWQPEAGVRSAIVVVPVNGGAGGFVMGGKSLAFVEQEEQQLTLRTSLGWVVMIVAVFLAVFIK